MTEARATGEATTTGGNELRLSVSAGDGVPAGVVRYAHDKLRHLAAHERFPILFGEVRLHLEPSASRDRPAEAEAVFDVNGEPVRAHVAARELMEAVDLLEDRMARRLERHRRRRTDRARRLHGREEHEWRHGDPPSTRPEFYDRPAEERRLVRRKTFAVGELTCDEAVDTLDLLGHDFLLFTNAATGADAVVHYGDEHGLELIDATGRDDALGDRPVAPVRYRPLGAPHCTVEEAAARLDLDVVPFVFHVDPDTGRGSVVYRRYDGHYGVITPA